MSYEIECFGDLRIGKTDMEELKGALEKDYYECECEQSAEEVVKGFMKDLGFVEYDEADAIRFERPRKDAGEVSSYLLLLAPFLEGQHVSWMGEEGEVWLDEFVGGKVMTTWHADIDDALLELARLKRDFALARD